MYPLVEKFASLLVPIPGGHINRVPALKQPGCRTEFSDLCRNMI
jgi:hypothetical protein